MTFKLIQYRVKAERAPENAAAVKAVFDELHQLVPSGLHYATFTLADGVTFLHFVCATEATGANALSSLKAFKAFSAAVKDRCDEQPRVLELSEVGVYRLFDR